MTLVVISDRDGPRSSGRPATEGSCLGWYYDISLPRKYISKGGKDNIHAYRTGLNKEYTENIYDCILFTLLRFLSLFLFIFTI